MVFFPKRIFSIKLLLNIVEIEKYSNIIRIRSEALFDIIIGSVHLCRLL